MFIKKNAPKLEKGIHHQELGPTFQGVLVQNQAKGYEDNQAASNKVNSTF